MPSNDNGPPAGVLRALFAGLTRVRGGTTQRDFAPAGTAPAVSLARALKVPTVALPHQVHGTAVARWPQDAAGSAADAVWSDQKGVVCAVRTADCLPLLLVDAGQSCVAAVHAGWRGLAAGVIEATLAALPVEAAQLRVWLGPAIGPQHFEVGPEVRAAFVRADSTCGDAFRAGAGDRYFADLYDLAHRRLTRAGVPAAAIGGGGLCTFADPQRWYSYRRTPGEPGRMLSFVQLT